MCECHHQPPLTISGGAEAGPSTSATISAPPMPTTPSKPSSGEAPPQQISMRALIVTQDASVIIGRSGAHVNEIRVRRDHINVLTGRISRGRASRSPSPSQATQSGY